jgi:hypothetical protein
VCQYHFFGFRTPFAAIDEPGSRVHFEPEITIGKMARKLNFDFYWIFFRAQGIETEMTGGTCGLSPGRSEQIAIFVGSFVANFVGIRELASRLTCQSQHGSEAGGMF